MGSNSSGLLQEACHNSTRRRRTACVNAQGGYARCSITRHKTLTDFWILILSLPFFRFKSWQFFVVGLIPIKFQWTISGDWFPILLALIMCGRRFRFHFRDIGVWISDNFLLLVSIYIYRINNCGWRKSKLTPQTDFSRISVNVRLLFSLRHKLCGRVQRVRFRAHGPNILSLCGTF